MARRVTGPRQPYGVAVDAEQQQGRAAVWVARLLAALAVVLATIAVALPVLSGFGYLDELTSTPEVAVAVSFSATGALLVGNAQARRIGWLLLAVGVMSAVYCSSTSWTAFELRGDDTARDAARTRLAALTGSERRVAAAVGRGLSNAEVAAELHMTVATVKSYLSKIMRRLDLNNRVQLALLVQDAQ